MNKNDVHAVRQILMNELGLTREVIRDEMRKIIEVEAGKVMNGLISQGHLEQIVIRKLDEVIAETGSRQIWRETIKGIVTDAAKRAASDFFEKRMNIVIDGGAKP